MGFFDKLKKITTNLFSGFSEADEAFFEELEETLILADLGMDTALDAVEKLRTRVRKEKLQDQEAVKAALRDILAEEMDVGGTELDLSTRPAVVLFIGVNGVGKTTSIGKLGYQLKSEGKRVLFCAADTFRAAAADQLQIWAERAGCELVRQHEGKGSSPSRQSTAVSTPVWSCSGSDSSRRRSTGGKSIRSAASLNRCWSMAGMRLKSRVASTGPTRSRSREVREGNTVSGRV